MHVMVAVVMTRGRCAVRYVLALFLEAALARILFSEQDSAPSSDTIDKPHLGL